MLKIRINFSVNNSSAVISFKTCSKNCPLFIFKMSNGGATTDLERTETVDETVEESANVQINDERVLSRFLSMNSLVTRFALLAEIIGTMISRIFVQPLETSEKTDFDK